MITELVAALRGATEAGDRVRPLILPAGSELPAIVYQIVSHGKSPTHDGGGIEQPRVQLSVWAASYSDARALYAEVDALLDGRRHGDVLFLAAGARDDEDESTREGSALGMSRVIADYIATSARSAA